jgi:hypothetical protein
MGITVMDIDERKDPLLFPRLNLAWEDTFPGR